ncbi:hypothetical protein [Archangium sp.]|uniref:hypothetical protein n=1 Tax=Archangium sp. TaxID=1872627 RepID=UPI003899AB6F
MKGLLLEDRWAPVTSEIGFLETDAEHAARAYAAWQAGLPVLRGVAVEVRPVMAGSLEQALSALLPLTDSETQRHLFIPTRSPWTAFVENGWRGTDATGPMRYMARTLGCRVLRVVAVPNTLRGDKGRYGAVSLAMYGPHQTEWLNYIRAVNVVNDGGRWVFDQFGEPFSFEKLEQYQARRVRDRFTFDMLREYLHHLGLSPFEESFYLPPGTPAWLVEKTGPLVVARKQYTLAEAREDL